MLLLKASMRPRPEGRGELWDIVDSHALTHRTRFNAATTRRPWRTLPFFRVHAEHQRASMRPRPEGRGELLNASGDANGHAASMRPRPEGRGEPQDRSASRCFISGFNAATTRRPWRTKPATTRTGARHRDASMRPRPEGRGEPRSIRARHAGSSLQCGHDPKAVENDLQSIAEGVYAVMLQCGHDPKAVENVVVNVNLCRPRYGLQCGHDPKAVENDNG